MTDFVVSSGQLDQLDATLRMAADQAHGMRANVAGPPGTTPPTTPPGSGGVVVVPSAFNWSQTGMVISADCAQGTVYAFAYTVPTGWTGSLHHDLLEVVGTLGGFDLAIWEAKSANGEAISGTRYDGQWIGGFFSGNSFSPTPGDYFFNVLLKNKSSPLGVQQKRNP